MLAPATPPPITTARAWSIGPRSGAVGGVANPRAEPRIVDRAEAAIEMLVGVRDVIEVERRDALLDDAPHGLAEVGHDAHQCLPREVHRADLAEVPFEQATLRVLGHAVVDREV